jgi:hypothetical protein
VRGGTRLCCQYLYFCTSKASKRGTCTTRVRGGGATRLCCQYLYFCTSKASKRGTCTTRVRGGGATRLGCRLPLCNSGVLCHSLPCLAARRHGERESCVSICTFVPVKQVKQVKHLRAAPNAELYQHCRVHALVSAHNVLQCDGEGVRAVLGPGSYLLYLLYWYKSTNTDAAAVLGAEAPQASEFVRLYQ